MARFSSLRRASAVTTLLVLGLASACGDREWRGHPYVRPIPTPTPSPVPSTAPPSSGSTGSTAKPEGSTLPFVALASGRVGAPYADDLSGVLPADVTSWALASGTSLPSGLSLDASGRVSGTPLETGTFYVTAVAAQGSSVEACVSVFSRDLSEARRGQWDDLSSQGPYLVSNSSFDFDWTSSFDGKTRTANAVVFVPDPSAGNSLPLVVHHRGRGFSHKDYSNFLTQVASHGIVCVSVSDPESFWDPDDPEAADALYDGGRAELGMMSASAAQEATLGKSLSLAASPGSAFTDRVDPWKTFVMGHSRGGGATQASHVRSSTLKVRGAIYLMAFDLRYFPETAPPAQAPAYDVPDRQPRLPSLILSAERDGDLVYPYADEFIDRATGPTTFATILGGCHDYLGDQNSYDAAGATIQRSSEQRTATALVVAFVRRWALDDLSLEALLYGDELETSDVVSLASWRRSSPLVLVDDFQGKDATRNLLGGKNSVQGLRETEESVYPPLGNLASLEPSQAVLSLTATVGSFSLSLGDPLDASALREVAFRAEQTGQVGWAVDLALTLVDASGASSTVQLVEGGKGPYLPEFTGASPLNRFVTVHVPLSAFSGIDLGRLKTIEFDLASNAGQDAPQVALDDVRFE